MDRQGHEGRLRNLGISHGLNGLGTHLVCVLPGIGSYLYHLLLLLFCISSGGLFGHGLSLLLDPGT